MLNVQLILIFSCLLWSTVTALTCTSCEFKLLPPYSTNCEDTCEGDVCFIVVNKFFNGTINAGCMILHDGDKFEYDAVCQRTAHDNRCACNSGDKCNDPKVRISAFTFTTSPVLAEYQWLPQIQPPQPSISPIEPLQPIDTPTNATVSNSSVIEDDLETGLESDIDAELSPEHNITILRNDEVEEITVTTAVGLSVGETTETPTTERSVQRNSTTTTGQGSVTVTRITSPDLQPRSTLSTPRPEYPTAAKISISPINQTSVDSSDYVDSARHCSIILSIILAVLML